MVDYCRWINSDQAKPNFSRSIGGQTFILLQHPQAASLFGGPKEAVNDWPFPIK